MPPLFEERLRQLGMPENEIALWAAEFTKPIPDLCPADVQRTSSGRPVDVQRIEKIRAADAARKRRKRAEKNNPCPVDAPQRPVDAQKGAYISLEEVKKEKKKKDTHRRAMSADWHPTQHAIDQLIDKGFPGEQIEAEVDKLRNWAMANGKTSTNWDLNLYNWMDNVKEWKGNGHTPNGKAASLFKQGDRFVTSSGKVF